MKNSRAELQLDRLLCWALPSWFNTVQSLPSQLPNACCIFSVRSLPAHQTQITMTSHQRYFYLWSFQEQLDKRPSGTNCSCR